MASGHQPVPFGEDTIAAPPVRADDINDEDAYHQNLRRWLDGDEGQRGDARQFFWNAFAGSAVVETISETEQFGAGARYHQHEFRKAHQFLAGMMASGLTGSDF